MASSDSDDLDEIREAIDTLQDAGLDLRAIDQSGRLTFDRSSASSEESADDDIGTGTGTGTDTDTDSDIVQPSLAEYE